jgi:hypothetical protein
VQSVQQLGNEITVLDDDWVLLQHGLCFHVMDGIINKLRLIQEFVDAPARNL